MRHTIQKEFNYSGSAEYVGVIPDDGASLDVEFWNGETWTADPGSPIIAPDKIYVKNLNIRITPTGGGYYIDEGGVS